MTGPGNPLFLYGNSGYFPVPVLAAGSGYTGSHIRVRYILDLLAKPFLPLGTLRGFPVLSSSRERGNPSRLPYAHSQIFGSCTFFSSRTQQDTQQAISC